MKVEGVALGTLVAQYAGLGMACLLWLAYYRPLRKYLHQKALFNRTEMKRFFQVNRDIFFRTLCLIAVTVFSPPREPHTAMWYWPSMPCSCNCSPSFRISWMDLPTQEKR